jgi:hypothetical protein
MVFRRPGRYSALLSTLSIAACVSSFNGSNSPKAYKHDQ